MDQYPITLNEAVRGEIKAELSRRGLTQQVLMDAWGITQPSVSIRLGNGSLTADDIDKAARALGYDPFDFVARAKRNAPAPALPANEAAA